MKNNITFSVFLLFLMLFIIIEPAIAGPGGRIASAAFETFFGRVVFGVLLIVLLPLIVYVFIKEKIAERRARKDLSFMATHSPMFELLKIQERAKDCFLRIHSDWGKEDLSKTSDWMTSWYWQNQQYVYLEKWKRKGLVNICDVRKINSIKPIFFLHRNDKKEHEGSMVVFSIKANMKDFLQNRETGKIVEGSKKYKDVETIWSFTLEDSAWKVSNIDEGEMSLTFAQAIKDLPAIETTLIETKSIK